MNLGSLKRATKLLSTGQKWINTLRPKTTNKKTQTRQEIVDIATDFYKKLYEKMDIEEPKNSFSKEQDIDTKIFIEIPTFTEYEILKKIETLKNDKSPGPEGVTNEIIKTGRHVLVRPLTISFNKIIEEKEIPITWTESNMVLLK